MTAAQKDLKDFKL